jgi:ribosomal protein S18 acetylase RimI-like enzyme
MPEETPSGAEGVAIRPMRPADHEAVLDLWERLMATGRAADPRYDYHDDARRIFRDWVRDEWSIARPFPRVLVASAGDRLVGYVQGGEVQVRPLFRGPRTASIGDLWVEEEWRRRGLGRALVEAFLAQARAAGIQRFEVGTLALDARAVGFWKTMGFTDWRVVLLRD